jgi:hypothetical protein
MSAQHADASPVCRVLAVLGDDASVAHAAADLARECGARLSLVQTWVAPVLLWGLCYPTLQPYAVSRERALAELAAGADERIRAIARGLDHPGPLDFRCCRGRVSTVASRAARTGVYDVVVVPDGRSRHRVLSVPASTGRRRPSLGRLAHRAPLGLKS